MSLSEFKEAVELGTKIYKAEMGSCGGDLHIVLDEYNCDSNSVRWCMDKLAYGEYLIMEGEILEAEKRLTTLLAGMNMAERLAVCYMIDRQDFDADYADDLTDVTEEDFNPFEDAMGGKATP